jgi:hypothetical protein
VIALTHNRWASWYDLQVMAIRLFRMSEYVHVGVAWVCGGRVFVLHEISGGVSITPLSHELPFYWIRSGRWTPAAEEFALATVGQAYSKWQAVLAGLGLLRGGADDRWECAEWANQVLARCGHAVGDAMTPDDLVQRLLELDHSIAFVEG